MTTMTITETQPSEQTEVVLSLRSTTLTAESVVRKMLESGVFTISERSQISHWASTVIKLNNHEDMAVALCYLLFTFVHPALLTSPNHIELLLEVEEEIKVLLKPHIPEEKDVEELIDERNAEQCIINKIAAVEDDFRKLIEHLYSSANTVNEHMAGTFENLKERLLAIKESVQSDNTQLKEYIESLIQEVEKMNEQAFTTASSVKGLGEKLDQQQQSMLKIINKGL